MKKLLNWRAQHPAIAQGKLTHFVPENGLYVYARTKGQERVLVLVNTDTEKVQKVDIERYSEVWPAGTKGKDVISGESFSERELQLPPLSIRIIESTP